MTSFTVDLELDYELPRWKAPDGTDPATVEAWQAALRDTRTYLDGYGAIAVQGAGRYLADADRRTFSSRSAMDDYYDRLAEKWLDWTNEQAEAYGGG